MTRRPLIAGNWKMNLNHFEAIQIVQKLAFLLGGEDYDAVDVSVHPPFTDIRSVQTLVLSNSFVALQPEVAEVFVRSALAQDAKVEVVSGDAARTLEESGGAGVLLRFSTFKSEPAREGELASV